MEPVTHALASLALARAGQRQLPRFGITMMVVAGVAADLDYASYFGGAGVFLRLHRAALGSVPGAVLISCVTAAAFCAIAKKREGNPLPGGTAAPLSFVPALARPGSGRPGMSCWTSRAAQECNSFGLFTSARMRGTW